MLYRRRLQISDDCSVVHRAPSALSAKAFNLYRERLQRGVVADNEFIMVHSWPKLSLHYTKTNNIMCAEKTLYLYIVTSYDVYQVIYYRCITSYNYDTPSRK